MASGDASYITRRGGEAPALSQRLRVERIIRDGLLVSNNQHASKRMAKSA